MHSALRSISKLDRVVDMGWLSDWVESSFKYLDLLSMIYLIQISDV
jgi:hypothetical protein